MNIYAGKYLIVIGFITFFSGKIWSQGTFTPDLSMDIRAFEKEALKPKNEIWVVDFWASWCRPCVQIIPELKQVEASFEGKPVKFISISYDTDKQNWLDALDHFQMPWNQILIPNARVPYPFIENNFRFSTIPQLFIILPSGKIKKTNEVDLPSAVEKQLSKLNK